MENQTNPAPVAEPIPQIPVAQAPAKKGISTGIKVALAVVGCSLFVCCALGSVAIYAAFQAQKQADTVNEAKEKKKNEVTPTQSESKKPTPTNQGQKDSKYTEDVIYPEKNSTLPISAKFLESMLVKKRSLSVSDGYANPVNAIGNPTYNFSIVQNMTWKQVDYTQSEFTIESPDAKVGYGLLFIDGNSSEFKNQSSCDQIAKKKIGNLNEIEKTEKVTIHGTSWDRIFFTLKRTETGQTFKAIGQCLRTQDAVLFNFIGVETELWNTKGVEYTKIMDDIYIYKVK